MFKTMGGGLGNDGEPSIVPRRISVPSNWYGHPNVEARFSNFLEKRFVKRP